MRFRLLLCAIFFYNQSLYAQSDAMQYHKILTNKAPQPIGTYSQAIEIKNMVFISGQIGISPKDNTLNPDFVTQTRQVFNNIKAISEASGGGLNRIVKLTIYLTDLSNFSEVNLIMGEYFKEPYPSRVTVQVVKLPKDAKIEVDAILYKE